jgi:virginiamycin B lyase
VPKLPALRFAIAAAMCSVSLAAFPGGSNYGVAPGTRSVSGKITEWQVPTPKFARDPAPGPDGNIYITVMFGNKIARFDTVTHKFNEWEMPEGARPHGLLVDEKGIVWYTGNGNGTIGELDTRTGKVVEHKVPSGGSPHTIVLDHAGAIWFSNQSGSAGRLDRSSGRITEYKMPGGPYGLAVDAAGNVWVCRMGADKLGRINPRTGEIAELDMGSGSRPRRIAAAPDGTLWVTLYGNGKLAHVDAATMKLIREYPLPGGKDGGPYAVNVDGAGQVWVNELEANTVTLLDPKAEKMRSFNLPGINTGIRKMAVDRDGRLWYMGSHNGKLGMIE